ncbi:transposase [Actinotignum urinale]|nr:transposase [Actinotignum urinale]WIK59782.1 transposase [Actinotignum urinale]
MQGYNVQAVADINQIILAVDVCSQPNDAYQLRPLALRTMENLEKCGSQEKVETIFADSGYFQPRDLVFLMSDYPELELLVSSRGSNMKRLKRRGRIPNGATIPHLIDRAMTTKYARNKYRKRKWMMEPVFSRLKLLSWLTYPPSSLTPSSKNRNIPHRNST